MQAVHFGAGNIGRGFIGEILNKNSFKITFVDINETIINPLVEREQYQMAYAQEGEVKFTIDGVSGINNDQDPEKVVQAIKEADIVTTAIGPNILPFIAELIAQGIQARRKDGVTSKIDVVACENMIGGSTYLKSQVDQYLSDDDQTYVSEYVGFPDAAVDRIVPIQSHEDPLFVSVEPFSEWVIDQSQAKSDIKLEGVIYVDDLTPYIERKLFSVNTGHATVAYAGSYKGYQTIDQAIKDPQILDLIQNVLAETGQLLVSKWGFDQEAHKAYTQKIIERFKNTYISDDVNRVARTPIRKLGYDERFIRPIREAKERGLSYEALLKVVGFAFNFDNPEDEESVKLQKMLKEKSLESVVKEVTSLEDSDLIDQISQSIQAAK